MARAAQYLATLFIRLGIVALIVAILVLVQQFTHVLDPVIAVLDKDVNKMDGTMTKNLFAGISIGTLVLIAVLFLVPFFHRGVNNKQYASSIFRGIISSAVFFATDLIYRELDHVSHFKLLVIVLLTIVVGFILIEFVAKGLAKREDEVAVRTDIVASIVSGLMFALIVRLAQYALTALGLA